MDKNKILIIDFRERLPDISKARNIPRQYENYGRFAVLNNGAKWFDYANSSHPTGTKEGFYWAISRNILYISPRGADYKWKSVMTDDLLRWLIKKLGLKKEYKYFKKVYPINF
jgi:hypothetical protein